jgi:hypothetical protein
MEVVDLAQPAVHGKVIEKTLPCGRVLGIVPFGGAAGIRTFIYDIGSLVDQVFTG